MRTILMLAVALCALAATQTATAGSTSYSCSYKVASGISAVLTGADLGPSLCRTFGSGMTRTSYAPGRSYCAWRMRGMDIRVTLRATTSYTGRFACSYMSSKGLGSEWSRIY